MHHTTIDIFTVALNKPGRGDAGLDEVKFNQAIAWQPAAELSFTVVCYDEELADLLLLHRLKSYYMGTHGNVFARK
jgi:hypothetical protein